MAFENVQSLGLADASLEEEVLSNKLDLSSVDSPFDSFNGLNLDNVKNIDNLLNAVSDVPDAVSSLDDAQNDQSSSDASSDDGPGKRKKASDRTAQESYDRIKFKSKIQSAFAGNVASTYVSPLNAIKQYEFDSYKTNVDRYRAYGERTFRKLGFNPLDPDMEQYYNANTSNWQDWKRMSGQFMGLASSAFTSNYKSIGRLLSGKGGVLAPDDEGAIDFEEANRLGASTKGGFTGFAVNLALNGAYTVGIATNIVAEEIAIWGLSALAAAPTGGVSLAAGAALQGAEITSKLSQLRRAVSASTGAGEIGNIVRNSSGIIRSLSRADEAKNFYQYSKGLGGASLRFLNPLRQTTASIKDLYGAGSALKNLSNYAKVSRSFGSFYRDMRENWFAVSESQLEGGGVRQEQIDSEISAYFKQNKKLPTGKALEDIYSNATAAGKVDVLGGIPLIFLTNRITLDNFFKFRGINSLIEGFEAEGAKFSGKAVFNASTKTIEEAVKQGFFKTTWGALKNPRIYAGGALSYVKYNFAEGIQELGQEWLSDATKRYYTKIYNDPTIAQSDLLKTSVYDQLLSTVSSKEAGEAVGAQIFSSQGLHTFASGFLMGGLIGGPKMSLSKLYNGLYNKISDVYLKKVKYKDDPALYQSYLDDKARVKARHIEIANKIFSNPQKYFSNKKQNWHIQQNANNNLNEADNNNDDGTFYNSKDEAFINDVVSSLQAGTFDTVLDGFKQLNKLDEKELGDYFNIQDGSKAKDKLQEFTKRANEIKNRYEIVNKNFKNPFDPKTFEKNSPEQMSEFMAYTSFEEAKKMAIMSEYGFDRSLERMLSVYQDLIKTKPLSKSSESDYSPLFDGKKMQQEIDLLNAEANLLEQSEKAADKKLGRKQKKKAEALADFLEKYENYQSNKISNILDDQDQEIISDNFEFLNPLKKSFEKYLKVVADINDDFVFNDKVDNAFNKLIDYYNLEDDSKRYMQAVNHLSNPANLLRQANRINTVLTDIFNDREKLLEEGIDSHLNTIEFNQLVGVLQMMGVTVDPEELIEFYKRGVEPKTFYDFKNGKVIDANDPRYETVKGIIETYQEFQDMSKPEVVSPEKIQEEEKEEETKKKEEAKKKKEEEEKKKQAEEAAKKKPAIPKDVETKLKNAYIEFISETGSDITFEEFERDHPTAAAIKAQTSAPKAEEKVIEVKLPEVTVTPTQTAPVSKDAKADIEAKKAEIERIKNRILPNQQKRLEDAKEIAANGTDFNEAVDSLQKKSEDARNKANERLKKEAAKEGVKPIDIQERLDTYEETKEAERYNYLIKQINDYYTEGKKEYFTSSSQFAITIEENELDKLNKRLEKVNAELNALKGGVKPTPTDAKAKYKREDFPDTQANTRTPVTQKLLDYFAEVLGIPKFTEDLSKGTYVSWLQNANPVGYAVADMLNAPKQAFDVISEYAAEIAALEGGVKPTQIVAAPTVNKVDAALNNITSIKNMPSLKFNDSSEASKKLLDLILSGEATSDQVLEAVKNKYEQLLKNLKATDFRKGDIVTFADGSKGIVNEVSQGDKSVKIKKFGTEKGQIETVLEKDLPKQITLIENPKEAMDQETEKVTVTPDMEQKSEEGKTNMNNIMDNDGKMKEAFNKGLNTNADDAENDFLNNLEC